MASAGLDLEGFASAITQATRVQQHNAFLDALFGRPSQVNDSAREIMARQRAAWQAAAKNWLAPMQVGAPTPPGPRAEPTKIERAKDGSQILVDEHGHRWGIEHCESCGAWLFGSASHDPCPGAKVPIPAPQRVVQSQPAVLSPSQGEVGFGAVAPPNEGWIVWEEAGPIPERVWRTAAVRDPGSGHYWDPWTSVCRECGITVKKQRECGGECRPAGATAPKNVHSYEGNWLSPRKRSDLPLGALQWVSPGR